MKKLLLFAIAVFTLLTGVWHAWGQDTSEEWKIVKESRFLAGSDGIDCGTVPAEGDSKVATRCALKAQRNGHPFRVIYALRGIDSFVAVAMVRTPAGKLFSLFYDSYPMGGGWSRTRGVVSKRQCPSPTHLRINPEGGLDCFEHQVPPLRPKE